MSKGALKLLLLIGNERDQPVLVGDAEPAARRQRLDAPARLVMEIGVIVFREGAVENTEQALVQDVKSGDPWRAGTRDDAEG